ncbi:MAG: carboxylate--amine ligase [Chromatiales bacterium]
MLVTDAERGSAIAIIRALGRAGYHVIAADSNRRSIGFRSRYVSDTLVYPPPESDSRRLTESLLDAATRWAVDLIIPVTDLVIHPITRARHLFERITRLALPPNELLAVVSDKDKTLEVARKLGVPVPQTFAVETSDEALTVAEDLGWPVVLKPATSAKLSQANGVEKFGVTYAGTPEELKRLMQKFEGRCPVLLQGYCQGVGYGVELLTYEGQPIAAFSHKRLREFPVTGGASSYRESVEINDTLYRYSTGLLKELRWTGLAMVEFKVNGSNAALMEINGRVWGSLPLAVASGVNFPLLLTKLFLEGRDSVTPQQYNDYKIGVRCRDLQKDLMWIASVLAQERKYPFLQMPSRLRALQAFAGIFNPARKLDLLCLDDPAPGLAEIPRIVAKLYEKSRSHSR